MKMIHEIRRLIAKGETEEAISEIAKNLPNQADGLLYRYNIGKEEYAIGLIEYPEWIRIQAEINFAIIKAAIEEEDASELKEMQQEKTTRAVYYIPTEVVKQVQEARASDPRTSPPSENACYVWMLRRGMELFVEMPVQSTGHIYRINRDPQYFKLVGIRLPKSLHSEVIAACSEVPQFLVHQERQEPVRYRYIDLAVALIDYAAAGFQIKNL